MVIEVKPLQTAKQDSPNEVTDEGMVIEVKPLQTAKQDSPTEVTDEGMVIEVKPLQRRKNTIIYICRTIWNIDASERTTIEIFTLF